MSDNEKLLQENTVKRFMTLAGNQTLAENFLNENKKLWEQVPGDEDMPPMDTEAPPELMPDMGDVEEPMPDMGDVEGEDEVEDVDLTAEEAEVLIGLGKKLEAEVGGEEAEEAMPPEGEEAGFPPEPTEAPPELLPGEEEEGAALEEAFVRELSRRVTERVRKEQLSKELQEQVVQRVQKEQLVETVMKRVAQRLRAAKKKRK